MDRNLIAGIRRSTTIAMAPPYHLPNLEQLLLFTNCLLLFKSKKKTWCLHIQHFETCSKLAFLQISLTAMVVNLLPENVKRMVLVVHVLRLFVIAAILCNMEVKFLVIWHQCRRDYRSIVKTEIKKSLLLLSELSGLNCRVITDTLKTLIKMNTLMLFTDSCLPHNQIDNFLTN